MNIRLVCPITRDSVEFFDRDSLLKCVSDPGAVTDGMTGAYVSATAGLAFPIEDGIHIFLPSAALKLRTKVGVAHESVSAPRNDSVRQWYDKFGWQKTTEGAYQDSHLFSFAEMTTAKRYEISAHLSLVGRMGSGDAILNAASGALPQSYHFAYFFYFGTPVCLDFSKTALLEAKQKLGIGGVYILADICHMPFADESFDSIVSAYTVQHIDRNDQATAVKELYRVLKRGRSLVIINQNADYAGKWLRKSIVFCFRVLGKLTMRGRTIAIPKVNSESNATPPHPLYYHAEPIRWWSAMGRELKAITRVECFRLLERDEVMRFFFHRTDYVGNIRGIERLLPRILAGVSAYLLIDLNKPRSD
jgi:ubiquinone/menaquinone biosynthesis C-methylase UbiE/uncharacterized protein YbaR (Trm112 family)